MVELQKNLVPIEKANCQLVGISYDSVEVLKSFADQKGISFPLLSDHHAVTENKTIHQYQVFDPRESGKYRGVPIPTTVVIGQDRKIRMVIPGSIQKRHSVDELLAGLKSLSQ